MAGSEPAAALSISLAGSVALALANECSGWAQRAIVTACPLFAARWRAMVAAADAGHGAAHWTFSLLKAGGSDAATAVLCCANGDDEALCRDTVGGKHKRRNHFLKVVLLRRDWQHGDTTAAAATANDAIVGNCDAGPQHGTVFVVAPRAAVEMMMALAADALSLRDAAAVSPVIQHVINAFSPVPASCFAWPGQDAVQEAAWMHFLAPNATRIMLAAATNRRSLENNVPKLAKRPVSSSSSVSSSSFSSSSSSSSSFSAAAAAAAAAANVNDEDDDEDAAAPYMYAPTEEDDSFFYSSSEDERDEEGEAKRRKKKASYAPFLAAIMEQTTATVRPEVAMQKQLSLPAAADASDDDDDDADDDDVAKPTTFVVGAYASGPVPKATVEAAKAAAKAASLAISSGKTPLASAKRKRRRRGNVTACGPACSCKGCALGNLQREFDETPEDRHEQRIWAVPRGDDDDDALERGAWAAGKPLKRRVRLRTGARALRTRLAQEYVVLDRHPLSDRMDANNSRARRAIAAAATAYAFAVRASCTSSDAPSAAAADCPPPTWPVPAATSARIADAVCSQNRDIAPFRMPVAAAALIFDAAMALVRDGGGGGVKGAANGYVDMIRLQLLSERVSEASVFRGIGSEQIAAMIYACHGVYTALMHCPDDAAAASAAAAAAVTARGYCASAGSLAARCATLFWPAQLVLRRWHVVERTADARALTRLVPVLPCTPADVRRVAQIERMMRLADVANDLCALPGARGFVVGTETLHVAPSLLELATYVRAAAPFARDGVDWLLVHAPTPKPPWTPGAAVHLLCSSHVADVLSIGQVLVTCATAAIALRAPGKKAKARARALQGFWHATFAASPRAVPHVVLRPALACAVVLRRCGNAAPDGQRGVLSCALYALWLMLLGKPPPSLLDKCAGSVAYRCGGAAQIDASARVAAFVTDIVDSLGPDGDAVLVAAVRGGDDANERAKLVREALLFCLTPPFAAFRASAKLPAAGAQQDAAPETRYELLDKLCAAWRAARRGAGGKSLGECIGRACKSGWTVAAASGEQSGDLSGQQAVCLAFAGVARVAEAVAVARGESVSGCGNEGGCDSLQDSFPDLFSGKLLCFGVAPAVYGTHATAASLSGARVTQRKELFVQLRGAGAMAAAPMPRPMCDVVPGLIEAALVNFWAVGAPQTAHQ